MLVERHKWKLGFGVFYALLLYCFRHVKGVVESEVPVCQAGDQLNLTCNTSGIFQRWEFTVFPDNMTYTATPLTSIGPSGVPTMPLIIGTSMVTFERLSGEGSLPLIARTTVNPVACGLNETVVNCFEGSLSTEPIATTTIRIIDPGQFDLSIQSDSQDFSSDGVTVNLEWTLLNSQTYYQQLLHNIGINAHPQLINVMFTGNMSAQLTLSYNTLYNVSVTQHSTCQQLVRTKFLELNYNKCSDPMELTDALVVGYEDPALEGQNITFTCPAEQMLDGSNISLCMGNGEWKPDPREVQCIAEVTATSNGTTSKPTKYTSQRTLGIVLGVIFGIILAATMTIVVIFLIIKRILKHSNNTRHPKYQLNMELNTHAENHDGKDDGTLVYADIGQRPAPVKSTINTLLLDDNRVEYALLDHNVQKHKVLTSQESSAANCKQSDNCPSVNLDNLLIQLCPQVGPKWYQFGEAAGIPKDALDKIAEQCPPDQCIIELFDYWLRNSSEPPTWKTVADVLKDINLKELGLQIEEVYVTGTLPIVVDMNHVPKLDTPEEEPPPPLPERSVNLYIDTPSHSVQPDSQVHEMPRTVPLMSNETSAPALPPKPPRMKSANT